ncbi:MAG TPA: T9SS type A sorting domain-containing protein [Cytophagaceae bacterium]|nr:T9SS type A sorting domain-containing protein [Cytophagaceae bacterium]
MLVILMAITVISSYATVITSTTSGGAWNTTGTWVGGVVPGINDTVVIATTGGNNVNVDGATGSCAKLTVNAGATFNVYHTATLNIAGTMTNNGTFNANTFGGGNILNINLSGLSGHWVNNATFSAAGTGCNVNMNGPGSYIGGTSSSTFYNLSINPGTSNIVSVNTNMSIANGGLLTLQSGIFKLGTSSLTAIKDITINLVSGNFANSQDGLGDTDADGGTLITTTSPPATMNFTGAAPILYNVTVNTGTTMNFPTTAGVNTRVNGTYDVKDGNAYSSTGNAFIWGPISKLNYTTNGNTFKLFTASGGTTALTNLWLPMASGTIGTTPGYPNDVSITNIGTSQGGYNNGNGWVPGGMDLAMAGTFTIGVSGGATNGQVDLSNLTSLHVKNLVVNKNSRLILPKATTTISGDFTDNTGAQSCNAEGGCGGASVGLFVNTTSSVVFSGGGTSNFTVATKAGYTETLNNLTVTNGTVLNLNSPLKLDATGVLTLGDNTISGSGYVTTSATNFLNVTNTNNTAVVNGNSTTAYVDGPLQWNIPAATTNVYKFPVGDRTNNGGAYLPFKLTPPGTQTATTVTIQGYNKDSQGSPDNSTLTAMSHTEYWSFSSSAAWPTNGGADVERPAPVSPFTGLGKSSSANGTYSSMGGNTASGTEISGGNIGVLAANTPEYIVMGVVLPIPLSVERVGGVNNLNSDCTPSTGGGTLIVDGVGGKGPYQFSMSSTGPWNPVTPTTGTYTFTGLSVGSYTVYVKDAAATVASATLQVLGPLQINGDNADITFCTSQSVTLTATNAQNSNPTYLWSPGGQTTASITVSPVSTTTYTVSSTVTFTGSNLLTNGGFEGGMPAGFSATGGYTNYVGGAYATTPGSGAYYKVSNLATNLCTNFSNPGAAEEGSQYFIADGGTSPGKVFDIVVSGLSANTTYSFSYWYMRGSVSAPFTPIETDWNGTPLGTAVASNTTWAQASYSITTNAAGGGTITLKNTSPTTSTNGNDFLIDNLEIKLLTTCPVTASMQVIIGCTSAPIELVEFNAVRQGNGALVTWSTATELNSSYYIVEKSTDGINFTPVGKVQAKGNSSALQLYSFIDPSISSGITYYRLVEYDVDGASQYSNVKSVNKEGENDVQIIPNPNNGSFMILFNTTGLTSKIIVLNTLGQLVYEGAYSEANVRNVDISSLASGIYYVQIITDGETLVKKMLKD